MIVVGIDPGSQRTGFAVIAAPARGSRARLLEIGVWDFLRDAAGLTIRQRPPLGDRLERLHGQMSTLLRQHNPHLIGLEKAVSFRNVASAHVLSEARGVLRLAAHQILSAADQRLVELSPTAVKRHASGWGASNKEQVFRALSLRFEGMESFLHDKMTFDAFDALAVAYTAWVDWKQRPLNLSSKKASPSLDNP